MLTLKANFRPITPSENGPIGFADILIANGVRLNDVAVFEKDGKRSLAFTKYGPNNEYSFVVPRSPEAYAAFLGVVEKAIASDKQYAVVPGENKLAFEITGARVEEPYADGRFSVMVGDLCYLNGIATREVEYEKDGKQEKFVSVDLPVQLDAEGKTRMYANKKGDQVASHQFDFLVRKWKDKEGNEKRFNYHHFVSNMVRGKRAELGAQTLEEKIAAGKEAAEAQQKTADAPQKEPQAR